MKANKFRKHILVLSLLILLIISFIILIYIIKVNEHAPAFKTPSNLMVQKEEKDISIDEIASLSDYEQLNDIKTPSTDNILSNHNLASMNEVTTPILSKEELYELPATTMIDMTLYDNNYKDLFFYSTKIDDNLKERITGISYKEQSSKDLTGISYDDLRYIRVLYYGFDNLTHIGELVVNKSIAFDVVDIFYELYEASYPIEKMILIDHYMGDDNESMKDNNTSSFNYRLKSGATSLSNHGLGLAIDINPLYNPYVKEKNGTTLVLPVEGGEHVNRVLENPYYIKLNDTCYNAFIKRGFTWGGSWNSLKDYQHFEKVK